MRRLHRWMRGHLPGAIRPVILMYHRVAEPACDPWGLSVSPQRFQEQLAALRACRRPMSVSSFVEACRSGTIDRSAVALTFDDGYADNLHHAKPLLEAAGIPATIFLTTGWLGSQAEFWWDELARIIFARAARRGTVMIGPCGFPIDLPAVNEGEDRPWRVGQPTKSVRAKTYLHLWKALQAASPNERLSAMVELRALAPASPVSRDDLPLQPDDVTRLCSPLIEIGAHAVTHQPLTSQNPVARMAEIADSRSICKQLTGADVPGFAYPHGDNDQETRNLVRQAGFAWACTTLRSAVRARRMDPYALPRLAVGDWSGERLLAEMRSIGG